MIIAFSLMYAFNAPPKSFVLFSTHVYLRNIIIKTSLINRSTEDRLHSSNQQ